MKLSIAMIVKNEEKNLERALIPLKELCEYLDGEIIVVDTGSTDNTIEIAKKYTDKLYYHEWCGDFSEMRNISINYCKGEWILIVDADEVLYDIKELVALIKEKNIEKYNGIFVKIVDFNKNEEETLKRGIVSPLLRILKKEYAQYEGRIHEQPMFIDPLFDSEIRFIHYGYNNSDSELMEYKFKRNLKLLLEELENDKKNIYVNFQIATSYLMHRDVKKAYEYIKIAYNECKYDLKSYIYVLDKYCLILYQLALYDELIDKACEGIGVYKNFLDFYFYLGEAYNNTNKCKEAIEIYKIYIDNLEKDEKFFNATLSIRTKGFKDNVLYNIALNYYKLKEYKSSLLYLMKIKNKHIIYSKVALLIKIIFEGEIYNEVNIINKYINKENYDILLTYIHQEYELEKVELIEKNNVNQYVKEILEIVKFFKENNKINDYYRNKIKQIMKKNECIYNIYIYYLIKYDVNEIDDLLLYSKEKVETGIKKICAEYYEANELLINNINLINNIECRILVQEGLIYARKIDEEKRIDLFLNYIADKYMYMVYMYNEEIITSKTHLLSDEERCIIQLREALSYKYYDKLTYIRLIKKTLNIEQKYTDYIKLLINQISRDENLNITKDMMGLVDSVKENVNRLISNEKYQEAYDIICETLKIIKYDFQLILIKCQLLNKFKYFNEVDKCAKDLILYGESENVIDFIKMILE